MLRFRTLSLGLLLLAAGFNLCATPLLKEGFTDITTLSGDGWVMTNNSSPLGIEGWFQGTPGVFGAESGATDSYIAANFNNAAPGGNVSNWLLSPVVTLHDGMTILFYTRTEAPQIFADSLEVRLSTNGASTDVGATDTSVGDFSNLVLAVNPLLNPTTYPGGWQQYTIFVSGLGLPTSGRVGFRYLVPDTNTNGNYIGIDSVQFLALPEPTSMGLMMLGLGALALGGLRRVRR
ncbi:choice-of-anchor J domain-containing protein [Paludibaculum fermentans]|uniref:choice-of-anchor J domain-containing protein n=1 Tax=Paludibaculum fermentans TaxID=1473598 RepID=UPI003EBEC82A